VYLPRLFLNLLRFKGNPEILSILAPSTNFAEEPLFRGNSKAPDLTLPQAILLLKATLEQPQLDAHKAIEIVDYYQRRHRAAYLSHRKRRSSFND
jgi:hypothetical protein